MSDYLYKKFYGKYKILLPIDKNTNDFPRDVNGKIESEDYYIPCRDGSEITHYKRNILDILMPSKQRANRLIQMCDEAGINIFHITEGNKEVSFRFKADDMDFIASYVIPKTMGKNIRPTSTKNLPSSDYQIPYEDLKNYKSITDRVPQDDKLLISRITNDFLYKKLAKSTKQIDSLKLDMKKKCMARMAKEYIHSIGKWEEYLKYLHKRVKENNND